MSEGSSFLADPKPTGKPSYCLLRQMYTYVYYNPVKVWLLRCPA